MAAVAARPVTTSAIKRRRRFSGCIVSSTCAQYQKSGVACMGRKWADAANRALLCKNGRMLKVMRTHRVAIMAWMVLSALGCLWIGHTALGQLRAAFETDARIVHRLLSQRAVQHDAIL